jgi:amidase
LRRHARDIELWWEQGWDVLLTPTTAVSKPPLLGAPKVTDGESLAAITALFAGKPLAMPNLEGGRDVARDTDLGDEDRGRLLPFTASFNVTGQPAITLPVHHSAAGYPIGVQLVAAYGREDLLFQLAARLEAAMPWADRRPPIRG